MAKFNYTKFLKQFKGLHAELKGDYGEDAPIDEQCYEIAKIELDMGDHKKDLVKYFKSLNISDYVGCLTDDIYSAGREIVKPDIFMITAKDKYNNTFYFTRLNRDKKMSLVTELSLVTISYMSLSEAESAVKKIELLKLSKGMEINILKGAA